jgi:hypothetical protein
MTENNTADAADSKTPDPLLAGVKSAVVHLGKAGFEVAAAFGSVVTGVTQKVRPHVDDDDDSDGGAQRVEVE